jgi:predicted aminopeptidase
LFRWWFSTAIAALLQRIHPWLICIPATFPRLRFSLLLTLAVLLSGCSSVGYYAQAVKGHCQIVSRQKSCEKLLASTNTPPELKARLQLAADLCAYANRELGLPAKGAYTRYANLERPYVVWNVYAAPEFSLTARTWWYPFVGSLDYRGYFNEAMARSYADKLAKRGSDVYVEGVEAYSTLGWFKDPLLNTFLHHQEPILAEVLFHELAHQKVFASGDTDFNEAFATVVAKAGVRRWLRDQDDEQALARYEAALERNDAFVTIVQSAREELKQLYEVQSDESPRKTPEAGKERIIAQLRENFETLLARSDQYTGYQSWFAENLNNAKLNSVATYYDLVPAFDRLLEQHQGELEPFYAAVKAFTKLPEAKRHQELQDARPTVAIAGRER